MRFMGSVVDSAEARHRGEAPATKEQIRNAKLAKERAQSHREVLTAYYGRGGSVWVPTGKLMRQAMLYAMLYIDKEVQ